MITLIARVTVAPANAAAFEALMAEVCAQVRAHEPEVPYYAFARSADDAGVYVVIEVYRDADAHAAHMRCDWIRASIPRAARLMAGRPEISQYVSPGTEPVALSMRD